MAGVVKNAQGSSSDKASDTKTSGIGTLEAFRDKYRITSTYSQDSTTYPINETLTQDEFDFHNERKDALGNPVPFPETKLQMRSSECYLFIDTSKYKEKEDLFKLIFPADTPAYVGEYYTSNDLGLGIWEFIITDVNIQHREANITTKVMADTIINHSAGATPVMVNLSGYLLEDLVFDHVYNITYMFENVLRATRAHALDLTLYLYLFGVYYKLEMGDLLFAPGINQGGYTPFRLASHGYNTSIDPSIMSKYTTSTFSYMTTEQQTALRAAEATDKKSSRSSTVRGAVQNDANTYNKSVIGVMI